MALNVLRYYSQFFPKSRFPPPAKPVLKPLSTHSFDETLARSLRLLLPILSAPAPSVPFAWLSGFVNLLDATFAAAAALISDPSLSGSDASALTAYLEVSVAFLDACNAVSAEIARLEGCLLHIRLAMRLLYSDEESHRPPEPERCRRARAAILEWENGPKSEIGLVAGDLVQRMTLGDPPRGATTAVRRATYAVETLSGLGIATVMAVLSGGEDAGITRFRVSGDWPWEKALNDVQKAVSPRLGKGFSGELEALQASVKKLAAVLDEDNTGRFTSAVTEVGRSLEKITEGLDHLSESVHSVFHAGIRLRNTALDGLRIGSKKV